MFQHFPSIEGFHNVVKSVKIYPELLPKNIDDLTYRAKVKLHGTNAAILILPASEPKTTKQTNHGGTKILAQSRSRIISSGDDNMGFAAWFEANPDTWSEDNLEQLISLSMLEKVKGASPNKSYAPIVVFGEWCGQGIMKGVAISDIDTKVFCVFLIQVGDSKDEDSWVITEPDQIRQLVPDHPQIKIIPWFHSGVQMFIDWNDTKAMERTVKIMNIFVDSVEACDPFVKETFNVEGTGEGLVFYPIIDNMPIINRSYVSDLMFKAKGEKHKATKQRNAIQIDPEVMESIADYVQKTVTDARLEQGAREASKGELEYNMKKVGPFLAWVGSDVKKETVAELEASELNWKMVQKEVMNHARSWYINKCKEL